MALKHFQHKAHKISMTRDKKTKIGRVTRNLLDKKQQKLITKTDHHEVENAFQIFKVSCLVRVYTDSHHNGHNKMIFAVSYV